MKTGEKPAVAASARPPERVYIVRKSMMIQVMKIDRPKGTRRTVAYIVVQNNNTL